jgi:hypothetical protein
MRKSIAPLCLNRKMKVETRFALAQERQAIKGKTEAAREIREAIEEKTAHRDDGL